MTVSPAQLVQITCPNCRSPVRAQVFTLVDVGQYPELKGPLISGQLNVAVCRACGTAVMITSPLVYHDPEKQLFLVFIPQQASIRPDEIERMIGDATNALMRSLPQDRPRAYLFNPRRFLTINTLIDAVLEADGITREMIEAQQQRVEIISRLAEAFEQGDEALQALTTELSDSLDYEFYAILGSFIEASAQGGRPETARMLGALRERLLELTGMPEVPEGMQADEDEEIFEDIDQNEALERLIEAPDDQLEAIIGEVRPVIDYEFFVAWTQRIDQAEQHGDRALAERLTARRTHVRETVERMDRQAQEMFERGATILNAVLAAPDAAAALREQGSNVDESFLLVLEAHIGAAERAGRADMVEQLSTIRQLATELLQEQLSPEDRFINELLTAETPPMATRILRQNPAMITTAFVKRLNELADEAEQAGRKPLGERLRQLAREAGAMLF